MREQVILACVECKQRNNNKRLHPDRIEQKKYCRFCGRHTNHKETR